MLSDTQALSCLILAVPRGMDSIVIPMLLHKRRSRFPSTLLGSVPGALQIKLVKDRSTEKRLGIQILFDASVLISHTYIEKENENPKKWLSLRVYILF